QGSWPGHRGGQAGTPAGATRCHRAAAVPELQPARPRSPGFLGDHQPVPQARGLSMSDAEAPVLTAVRNQIGHLTLNRPAGLNALTLPMIRALWQQLQAWEDDPQIFAVVLRATGEKAFCAGGDIRALYDSYQAGDNL